MKKIIVLLNIIIVFTCSVIAQVPNQFNYQAVARNTLGQSIPNANIRTRFTILDGSATGTNVYSEVRLLTTNQLGLFTAAIGGTGATNVTGNFATIDWSTGKKFIKVEADPLGGTNFLTLGNTEMLSVPYALYAVNGKVGQQGLTGATGATGTQGPQGIQGLKSLVKTTDEPIGPNCAAGGTKIESGIDANSSNILEPTEVITTNFICNVDANNTWKTTGNAGTTAANFIGTTDFTPFITRTNGIERIRVNATGNVGLSTVSPLATLHVNGASIIANAQTIDPDISINSVIAGAVNDGNGWGVQSGIGGKSNFANGGNTWGMGVSGGDLNIGSGNGSTDNTLQTAIKIKSNRNVELAPVNGNVIIGSGDARAKLTVRGTLSMPIKLVNEDNYVINPINDDYQIVMNMNYNASVQLYCFLPTPTPALQGRIYCITAINLPFISLATYNAGFGFVSVVGDFLLTPTLYVDRPHLVRSSAFFTKLSMTVQCVGSKWLIVNQNMWIE